MIFGAVPLAEAEGALLAHGRELAGRRVAKGTRLNAEHLAAAARSGLGELVVARLEPGDVGEDAAATALARHLAGPGLAVAPPVHGRVNLLAQVSGLLVYAAEVAHRANLVDEALTLGVLAPCARVAAREVVATIKVIPYAVPECAVAALLAATPAGALAVHPFRAVAADLVQTLLPGQSARGQDRLARVTTDRLAAIGARLARTLTSAHETAALARLLAQPTDAALTLVSGASAPVDRRDVVPAAIEAAGGQVERLGMPVDPGNLLCLGRIGARVVLGLPGCAKSPKRNGIDFVLERLAAGLPLDSAAIAAMGVGGLLADTATRGEARRVGSGEAGPLGAIVLAAGRASRMGSNKLLADLGGRPLVTHVVDAVLDAGLPPPIVVTGHEAERVAATLDRRNCHLVHAPDYGQGLSRSLAAGVAAAPADWRGAIICLGDMPRVASTLLGALDAALAAPDGIVVPSFEGRRGNPVAWGRDHFGRLAALEGDVGGKALLSELSERVIDLPWTDDSVLADVDTPEGLAAERARRRAWEGAD